MKNYYKLIKSNERRTRTQFNKTDLITMLINLKSFRGGSIYKDKEIKRQLLYVLRGTKSWSGDVKKFFFEMYKKEISMPCHIRSYYGRRYKYTSTGELLKFDDIPF